MEIGNQINGKSVRVWKTAKEIQEGISKAALKINEKFKNVKEPIIVIGILNGAFIFCSDLVRELNFDFKIDFIKMSSYSENKQTDTISYNLNLKYSIENCHIIIAEDIIDSGKTMELTISLLTAMKPLSYTVCTLISKPLKNFPESISSHTVSIFDYPNNYVVGYGLDDNETLRHLRDIYLYE